MRSGLVAAATGPILQSSLGNRQASGRCSPVGAATCTTLPIRRRTEAAPDSVHEHTDEAREPGNVFSSPPVAIQKSITPINNVEFGRPAPRVHSGSGTIPLNIFDRFTFAEREPAGR